jgi:hypothetical protein
MRGFIASVKSLDVDGMHFSPSLLNRRRTALFSIYSKQEKYQPNRSKTCRQTSQPVGTSIEYPPLHGFIEARGDQDA